MTEQEMRTSSRAKVVKVTGMTEAQAVMTLGPASTHPNEFVSKEFRDDVTFRGVQPMHLSEAEEGAVRIAYEEKFRDAFALLRRFTAENLPITDIAFLATTKCMELNPANYTLWVYRRRCLKELGMDLEKELEATRELAENNSKNYQIWHHRKTILEILTQENEEVKKRAFENELEFLDTVLGNDPKNYHAWQHRQWLVNSFKKDGLESEVAFADSLIKEDVRNNSAWNYRFNVVSWSDPKMDSIDENVIAREIQYTCEKIQQCPNNESSWNYLRGIMELNSDVREQILQFCKAEYLKDCPFALSCMVDIHLEHIEDRKDVGENKKEALEILGRLRSLDYIRENYWNYMTYKVENESSKT
ncbi:hypothetical protein L596_008478 [Steinernema carpocapsae]|uniref:Protein farnesyltransferase/geranylgeranyltransferase type-1 subunit alpha n=1 Tax=Steinernema carpocapsae TaxID=34508 RepID=A0A4U5PCP7_STECR|nr:hypothetical protein L596_008478 [Steinernema carpocapsae]